MPSLNRLITAIAPLVTNTDEAERIIRLEFGGSRINVPPLESRKRPGLVKEITRLSRTLPTGVVAARLQCSEGYVRRVVAQRKTPKSAKSPSTGAG